MDTDNSVTTAGVVVKEGAGRINGNEKIVIDKQKTGRWRT